MKEVMKSIALSVLTAPPVYSALQARALRQRPATILCYHTLRPDDHSLDAWVALRVSDFRDQIDMLRKSYDIVSLDEALAPSERHERPCVALTFDDGEIGLFDDLLPLVRELDIPVTIYVATGHIETGHAFWFDRVMNALQGANETNISLDGFGEWRIGPERGKVRWEQIGPVLEAIKSAPTNMRDALADVVATQAGSMASGFKPLQPMTLAQLAQIAAEPRVTLGAHSHAHELLDQLSIADATHSIVRSRDLLREWTGQDIRHFAYPNGNYSPDLMDALQRLGFRSSTILEDRLVHRDAPVQALPRIGVGRFDALARLKLRLIGL